MRLIDADALNKELQRRVGSPTDDKLYEVNLCIIDAPTIDAIPVEWIQAQRIEHPQTVVEFAQNVAYRTVLYGWRAEQEAQDG